MAQDKIMQALRNLILLVGIIVFVVLFFNFMQWANLFVILGHDGLVVIISSLLRLFRGSLALCVSSGSAVYTHLDYYRPLYLIALTAIATPVVIHLSIRSGWKHQLSQCEEVLKSWQAQTNSQKTKNKNLVQKYDNLKEKVKEAAHPCIGEVKFEENDAIVLEHPFCADYQDLKRVLTQQRKENLRLSQEASLARRKGYNVNPTPDYIAAMKCETIRLLEGQVERLQIEEELRTHQLKELKVMLNNAQRDPQAKQAKTDVARLEKDLNKKAAQLIEAQNDVEDLKKQIHLVVKQSTAIQAQLEATAKSKSALEKRIAYLEKVLQDKDSEIESLKQSAKPKVQSERHSEDELKIARDKNAKLQECLAEKEQALCKFQKMVDTLSISKQIIVQAPADSVAQTDDLRATKDELDRSKAENLMLQTQLQSTKQKHESELAIAKAKAKKWYDAASRGPTGADVRGSQEYKDLMATANRIEQERTRLQTDLAACPTPANVKAAEEKFKQLYSEAHDAVTKVNKDLAEKQQQLISAEQVFAAKEKQIEELQERVKKSALSTDNKDCAAELEAARQTIEEKEQKITEHERQIVDLKQMISNLTFSPDSDDCTAQLDAARQAIGDRDQTIAEKDKVITEQYDMLQKQDDHNAVLARHIKDRDDIIRARDALLVKRDDFINEQGRTIKSLTEQMDDEGDIRPLLDTGAMVKSLQREVDSLNSLVSNLRDQNNEKDDLIARNDQTIRGLEAKAEVNSDSFRRLTAGALQGASLQDDIDEIQRIITLYAPPGISDMELPAQINLIVSRAQDAQLSYDRLNTAGLIHPQNGERLDQHVGFAISEMVRHREGGATFYNLVVAVEQEMDRRLGPRPAGTSPGQTTLARVKQLVDRP